MYTHVFQSEGERSREGSPAFKSTECAANRSVCQRPTLVGLHMLGHGLDAGPQKPINGELRTDVIEPTTLCKQPT